MMFKLYGKIVLFSEYFHFRISFPKVMNDCVRITHLSTTMHNGKYSLFTTFVALFLFVFCSCDVVFGCKNVDIRG